MSDNAIRQELIEYLDPQFHGVVAKDVVGEGSGAHKVISWYRINIAECVWVQERRQRCSCIHTLEEERRMERLKQK